MDPSIPVHSCPSRNLSFPFEWSNYDFGIVSSFSLFIPGRIISQLPLINIHPSLLPQWRGPAPIQFALLNGQNQTGVSIIDLHPKTIDAGKILAQVPLEIPGPDEIFYPQLEEILADLGGELTAQVLNNFSQYWSGRRDQIGQVSQSRKICKEDGLISFSEPFIGINRKIRALSHQIPIKTFDLVLGKQVILEDLIFPQMNAEFGPFPRYEKSLNAVLIKIGNNILGAKKFKIDGKSQIFTAGSFYSNYLKYK